MVRLDFCLPTHEAKALVTRQGENQDGGEFSRPDDGNYLVLNFVNDLAMAFTDDQWVRLFNVSDPRRAYAGHTLYKVTSKVFQKEFPEGATEIAVWRRFSDFKKLHHELLKIFSHKHLKEEEFPPFPKAKFFGRFEEGVIEERRKAALELLHFAGNIPDLFTSQPFVKFFEGGFPDSPILSDSVASPEGSSSDAESESPRTTPITQQDANSDNAVQTGQPSSSPSCTSSKENGDNLDDASLGGVWLYKQPSLTEGLDNLSSDEEGDGCQEPSESTLVALAEPKIKQTGLTRQSNEETNLDTSEGQDDVFVDDDDDDDECSENEAEITEKKEMGSSSEPPNWLVRAISICSEGEDLEALASEADTNELSFPQAFSDYAYCGGEQRTSDDSELLKKLEGDYPHHKYMDTSDINTQKTGSSSSHVLRNNFDTQEVKEEVDKTHHPESSESTSRTRFDSENSLKDSSFVSTTEDKQSFTSSSNSAKGISRQRTISDLGNIYIDPKESDYLYAAGHTIHKALDCEVNGRYEEAFGLYKSCVGLLLSGVQGEKDIKRREAVRRKTAQYLLKAEALYSTYLAGKDLPEKPEQDSVSPRSGSRICESDDLQKFKDLTLADLKVMGIVGKVMLVENIHSGETYVVKALCKSGATRAHGHSHGNERRRRRSVRRLYGKYPNIVRLYRYFETATTIYLLLEYAQGGRLWDHIACYQSHKESLEYVKGRNNQRNAEDLDKLAHDQTGVKTVGNKYTNNPERLSSENGSKALEGENSCVNNRTSKSSSNFMQAHSERVGNECTKSSHPSVAQSKLETNIDGVNVSRNDHNNKPVSDGKETCESKKEAANKPSLFVQLDEYFASSTQHVPSEHIQIWAAELVLAVAYLHTAGIICRDLNPKNVLLDEEGHVLLTYFGSWEETEHIADEEAMNHFYCAPETWQVDEVTAAADWWSVGALLYEMITGQALSTAHPWGIKPHTELQLPMKISPEAKSLLRELLRVIPSERLGSGVNGVEEIKSHPFFSGVNWGWLCSRIN